jgi:PAS domain S-box-containing protein
MIAHDPADLAQALFEEIGDALFLIDPDADRLVDVNPTALRLTGFGRDELFAFPASHLFRMEAGRGRDEVRRAVAQTAVFHAQDGYLLRAKGEPGWVPVGLTVSRLHVAPKPLGLITARDDRARRAALAQARRMEAELRAVLAASPAALWSAEPAGPAVWQFRYVAPHLAALAGRPDGFPDHPFRWAEAVHPADRDGYKAAVRGLLGSDRAEAVQEYRVLHPDGAVRWVRDRLRVTRTAAGRPARLDGCIADVTAERQAADALRGSERRFRALVEKTRDGILLIDPAGKVLYASPASRSETGYAPADLEGKSGFALVHPDDLPEARRLLAEALAHPGEYVSGRFRSVAADGAVRDLEATGCNRLADPSVRAVVVNYRDVTDRDRAARERERQAALLAGLFASLPDVVCYKDRDLRFLGGNPAFEELAGRPVAELVGRHCGEVFDAPWADRLRAVEPGVLEAGTPVRAREWVTYPDGRAALMDIVVSPLKGADGAPNGLIVVARDVTDRDRLEAQLREAQKLEAVGRLAGGIAHDFNNLLTVVLGNLELVRSGADPAEAADLLAGADRAARHAADLTRQMLGFARRQPVRTAEVDLNALARDALALIRRSIDPRIAVDFRPDPSLGRVPADPVQLQQVVMNLCLNARDAMPEGGTLTVSTGIGYRVSGLGGGMADEPPGPPAVADPSDETRTPDPETRSGRLVRLSVADTGVGMPPEVRAKVFEPFFTTKEVGKGTGLGLAVVHGVAHAHGGWVDCHSQPGQGTRFDVFLPAAAPECGVRSAECGVQDTALPAGTGRGTPPEMPSSGTPHSALRTPHSVTVLVADDEPGVRTLARAGLELAGFRVEVAEDGAGAVEAFRRAAGRFGLVVLDATMPVMTGRQAFEAIRAVDPAVPVLFASGYPDAQVVPIPAPPRTGFLHKPYTPAQLAAEARRLLAASG